MTKKKTTDTVEAVEAVSITESMAESVSGTDNVKAAKKKTPRKYIYVGATLPNSALKSNSVFDGTFEDVCGYLRTEIGEYPLIKELLIPIDRLSVSGTSSRIGGLKKELLKSFGRRK